MLIRILSSLFDSSPIPAKNRIKGRTVFLEIPSKMLRQIQRVMEHGALEPVFPTCRFIIYPNDSVILARALVDSLIRESSRVTYARVLPHLINSWLRNLKIHLSNMPKKSWVYR